ncbi:amidase [Pseudohaliea rubra]|uniref:Aspartyl-tRNA(Asn) amidotransferase subunit A n=1 Tax=Pseudohaliea rubra DSM 19751 TaxID=1265313 RepID=A0A095XW74_9GAMM|nr:amidase [Pseudohaliea rubra]KGE03946.1 Aspartyl-tRNA(Asn) amidotransferase subunit A [Pseudohaliea rubra DSM 19751]
MSFLYRSAFALAGDIKAGRASAVDAVEFFLGRIDTHNGALNAVIAVNPEAARQRAREADAAAARGEDWGALHGVPLTIKDAFATGDLPTVAGIAERAGRTAAENAVAVQRYLDAGAILLGKTNVPFMSADLQSYNDVYGTTNNPWAKNRTCGGSSGGAAAALAAGLTPLELGSDIGGSIRTPSHFNGVFGHKSSYGLISLLGHIPPAEGLLREPDLSVAGPLATSVADLEQALALLLGPAASIAGPCAGAPALAPARFREPGELRVAVWADDPFCPVHPAVRAHILAAAETLEELGAQVDREARPAFDAQANHENYTMLMLSILGADMPAAVREQAAAAVAAAAPEDMSEPLLQLRGIALSHRDWLREDERRQRTRRAWADFFKDFDVLLCPCAHVPAFPHDHSEPMQARTLEVDGQARPYTEILRWAGLTLNAYLPATAVPLGITDDGLPVGCQIAGPYLGDRTALAVAALLEQHHRAFVPPPGYAG